MRTLSFINLDCNLHRLIFPKLWLPQGYDKAPHFSLMLSVYLTDTSLSVLVIYS